MTMSYPLPAIPSSRPLSTSRIPAFRPYGTDRRRNCEEVC